MTNDSYERWRRETYDPAVRRVPERKPSFATESDLDVAPLYGPADAPPHQEREDPVGFPGEYPFTRGVQPSMYRGRLWTMRQYAGFSTPEDSNARYRFLLSQGQTGLSVAFDLPTQTGYDADHELARAEIGKVGVPHLQPRRHGGSSQRPPPRRDNDLDDHQRHRANAPRPLPRGRAQAGRPL